MIKQEKPPNISYFTNNGITSENCITSYPSVTPPCHSNISIGAYFRYYIKEGSGVPSYHWINRTDPTS